MLHWLWLSTLVLILDQASKWLASAHLAFQQPLPVVPGFFNLTLAHNRGAAFSLFHDASGWQRWLFVTLALTISAILMVWLARLRHGQHWLAASLALIIGGAVGNLIDRLRLGYVIDFLDVYVGRYHWPTFNVADSAISVGAAILLILTFRGTPAGPR